MATAYASMKTYLGYKTESGGNSYSKLVDIKDVPDLGSEPETIDTTTLSNENVTTSILGLQSMGGLSFTYNYEKESFTKIKALDDGEDHEFAICLPDLSVIEWKGKIDTWLNGFGTNAVIEATAFISLSTEPKISTKSATLSASSGEVTGFSLT